MANYKRAAERYNDRMHKIFEHAKQLERENLERGGVPNPGLTSPETVRGQFVPFRDTQLG